MTTTSKKTLKYRLLKAPYVPAVLAKYAGPQEDLGE